ncbi:MAG: SoxR reducing system RseC family protein [Candidatus Muirbacterium halophilum]|nr:SoxR reducing system RseC family protein [Candidatus Muirbacterium halophilum]MCK9475461.1 SoxR reducing system RseC family protein [Candidatus Muirbacterium halophilum]
MLLLGNKVVMRTGIVRKYEKDYVLLSPLTNLKDEIKVKTKWELNKGDIVKFAYFVPKVYFYSFVINVVPFLDFIFMFLLSYIIVDNFLPQFASNILAIEIISGLIGFIISKSLVVYFDTKTTLFDEYKPVILAVMQKNQNENEKSNS